MLQFWISPLLLYNRTIVLHFYSLSIVIILKMTTLNNSVNHSIPFMFVLFKISTRIPSGLIVFPVHPTNSTLNILNFNTPTIPKIPMSLRCSKSPCKMALSPSLFERFWKYDCHLRLIRSLQPTSCLPHPWCTSLDYTQFFIVLTGKLQKITSYVLLYYDSLSAAAHDYKLHIYAFP